MRSLQTVTKHRTVDLFQKVWSDLDHMIGPNTEDVSIECGVVDFAHRQPIAH